MDILTYAALLGTVFAALAWLATRWRGTCRHHGGPAPWDDNDLTGWHPAHRDPSGDVWAVKPPFGHETWDLYRPGSPVPGPFHYAGVEPASTSLADDYRDGEALADVEYWMRPWVERASGGTVVDMVEGWGEPYGPDGDLLEYVIYARVAR